jgi:3-hydroxy-9,10-secoandrosta-1,3,5(10)-triene-9,17-dione monooxygenase
MAASAATRTTDERPTITTAEMVERAIALVPTLRERADHCEAIRRIPDETRDDFIRSSITRIPQPVARGGIGLDMDSVYEVAMELGRGCGSSAWMGSFWPLHNWMVGMWPKAAQDEYWANSSDALSSTAWDVVDIKVEPASGGIRLSGHWDYSSGIDHADWAMVFVPGPPVGMALVPRKDFRVVDTWHATGLCGSGSNDLIVEGAFVPDYRILNMEAAANGQSAGRELHGTPFYRLPLYTWLTYSLAAPIIGMGQGAVEAFEDLMRGRVEGIGGARAAERPANHLRLAESSAEIDAVRVLMRRNLRQLIDWANADAEIPVSERLRIRRDITFGGMLCNRAARRLFEAAGAHSIKRSAPLQRFARDAEAAIHSGALTWDSTGEQYGRVRLGLAPTTFFY